MPVAVKHHHTVAHVIEGHTQHGTAPLKLACPLLDNLLQPRCRLLALLEQSLQLDGIVAKDLDRAGHRCNLIDTTGWDRGVQAAVGDGKHAVAERCQATDNVAADIQPDNQDGGQQTQRHDDNEGLGAKALHRQRIASRPCDVPLGCARQLVDRGGELSREGGIFGKPIFSLIDQNEFPPASIEHGARSFDELSQLRHLLQE